MKKLIAIFVFTTTAALSYGEYLVEPKEDTSTIKVTETFPDGSYITRPAIKIDDELYALSQSTQSLQTQILNYQASIEAYRLRIDQLQLKLDEQKTKISILNTSVEKAMPQPVNNQITDN